MRLFHIKLQFCTVYKHNVTSFRKYSTVSKPPNIASKKYSDTLLLPKTKFPQRVTPSTRVEHEAKIVSNCQFENLYGLQRLWRANKPEYILHDGPPYANGDAHIGHAVNKILKDITNRYKLLSGYQVNYIPGWDCHGLPIELTAMKSSVGTKSWNTEPLVIRKHARQVATEYIGKQMNAFRRWGVMAEWNNSYKTFDKDYIKAELQLFFELFQKGFVYRGQKPVFWSPTSRSALAEAELEYHGHQSTAVYVGLKMCSDVSNFASIIGQHLPPKVQKEFLNCPLIAPIWTTTPWSLPANAAIAFNKDIKYTLLLCRNTSGFGTAFFIVATECLKEFNVAIKKVVEPIFEFDGSQLSAFQYEHPWFEDTICPFLHGGHVTTEKGTGLVHTAPAHGADDYVLAVRHKLPIECYINDDGCFDDRIKKLKGMSALSLGTNQVIKNLDSKIIHQESYFHSYPFDWRTKKPVIVKTSMQWFIDTEVLKSAALEKLESVGIHPQNIQHNMVSHLVDRPYWCISRQRSWGVPIPVLLNKETGEPLVHKGVIDRLCDLVELSGSVDAWWEVPVGTLIQNEELASQYEKGKDIFDIWLDSGLSWHMYKDKVADLYLEGVDQFNGWFHSSLLTSIALRGVAPYKNLLVHGFVVDESGKKMSKSQGNVINPQSVTDGDQEREALGADVLRWWCATQGSGDISHIHLSNSLLQQSEGSVQKLRNTLRFLVSFCTTESLKELEIDDVSYDELMYIDQYMLSSLKTFQEETIKDYENYNYDRVMNRTLHFVTTEISHFYLTWIKDRLYCDHKESQSRKSCIFVLNEIYLTLAKTLAPVLPYLCEEAHSHYNNGEESLFKSTWCEINEEWENTTVSTMMDVALDLRTTVNQIKGSQNSKILWAQIICNETAYQTLQMLHPTNCSEVDKSTSELCDILQLSGIDLRCSEEKNFTIESSGVGHSLAGFSVAIGKTEMFQCHRCRRYCCIEGNSLCSRCQSVLNRTQQQPPQNIGESPKPEIPDPVKEEILLRNT